MRDSVIALKIDGDATLSEANRIFDRLDSIGVDIDYGSVDFTDDGIYFRAAYDRESTAADKIENIPYVSIDWLIEGEKYA